MPSQQESIEKLVLNITRDIHEIPFAKSKTNRLLIEALTSLTEAHKVEMEKFAFEVLEEVKEEALDTFGNGEEAVMKVIKKFNIEVK